MADDTLISFGERHKSAPLLSESLESEPDLACNTRKAKDEPEKTFYKIPLEAALKNDAALSENSYSFTSLIISALAPTAVDYLAALDLPFDLKEQLHDPHNDILEILGSLVTISTKIVLSDTSDDTSSNVWDSALDNLDTDLLSKEVRLAHFLVKEYLLSDRIQNGLPSKFDTVNIEADHLISESSLLYILYYNESDSKATSFKDLENFPILHHACQFWYIYTKSIPLRSRKSKDPITLRLFLPNNVLVAWLKVHRSDILIQKPFSFSEDVGSPLYYALDVGLEAVVRLLLEHKADVNAKDKWGWTVLHMAAQVGNEALARQLLEHKADIDTKDSNGWTALYWAAGGGYEAVVRLLLEHKASIDTNDNVGRTALQQAVKMGHKAIVRLLLEHKADVDMKDANE